LLYIQNRKRKEGYLSDRKGQETGKDKRERLANEPENPNSCIASRKIRCSSFVHTNLLLFFVCFRVKTLEGRDVADALEFLEEEDEEEEVVIVAAGVAAGVTIAVVAGEIFVGSMDFSFSSSSSTRTLGVFSSCGMPALPAR